MNKKIKIIIAAIFLFNIGICAQSSEENYFNKLLDIIYNNLESKTEGVSESAIFVSLQLKSKYPNIDSEKFIDALEQIVENSKNAKVSYKAELAKLYFQNPDWFEKVEIKSILMEEEVYVKIAEKISSKMFAVDIR